MGRDFFQYCTTHNIPIQQHINLAPLCAFKCGGHAEMFCMPTSEIQLQTLLQAAHHYHIPIHILGGGSNVLAPDTTLQGLTIHTALLNTINVHEHHVEVGSGVSVSRISSLLAHHKRSALEFLYAMPGSIGGALLMNARCYGSEIADVLISATGYSLQGEQWHYTYNKDDFEYKKSPFTTMGIITQCSIATTPSDTVSLWNTMLSNELDRTQKGHFIAPCAGSFFKNNYDFGMPTGKLLDQLNWRNKSYKHAQVNPYHANIIINTGQASSYDIYTLSQQMEESIYNKYNLTLEREVVLLGGSTIWKQHN